MKKAKLTCYGGVGVVTGANFLIEFESSRVLVDCGMLQGDPESHVLNKKPFEYDPASIDYLFITHAHMDHIGRVPKLVHDGFRGTIYSTPFTQELAPIMFNDALGVMGFNLKEKGEVPLYDKKDVEQTMSQWKTVSYYENKSIADFSVTPKDAGHILGSAMFEFSYGDKKMVFTGDLGNSPTPLLRDTDSITDATYVLMESVYGDRNHESKKERDKDFERILKETIGRGGTVIIPTFSLERTQVILYAINNLVEGGHIPSVPVFLDSPLAIRITEVYQRARKNFKEDVQKEIDSGDDIFNFPKLKFTMHTRQSRKIEDTKGPKIICAGSGMSTGGRVVSHEAMYLPDSKNTVMLVGYQALGTLGRELQNKAKKVTIHDKQIPVKAHIEMIQGFSSHKDSDNLIEFVSHTLPTLKKVFVAMGEPKASLFLAQRIKDEFDVPAIYPERLKTYELDF